MKPNTPILEESKQPNQKSPYILSDFAVGAGNKVAFTAMKSVINSENESNLIVVTGGNGFGKTHLLSALNIELQEIGRSSFYCKATHFTNEFINSLNENKASEFRNKLASVDVLLLDDVEQLIGKERTQQELTIIIESLLNKNKLVVLTMNTDITNSLSLKLEAIIKASLHVQIGKLDMLTSSIILQSELKKLNCKVNEDTALYLAAQLNGSVSEIKGAVKSLAFYCKETEIPINMYSIDFLMKNIMVK